MLENSGRTTGLMTQNIDGLHSAAGTATLTELHGSLHWVCCLACAHRIPRIVSSGHAGAAQSGSAPNGRRAA